MSGPPTVTANEPRPPRPKRWVPLSLRMFLVILVLVGVGSVLWIGIPAYRQHLALEEFTRIHAWVRLEPRGPAWLRQQMGDERMKDFDEVVAVHLHEAGDC